MSVIVITGCSTGFGFQAAQRFAERGDHVFATMRNPEGKNKPNADKLTSFAEAGGYKIDIVDLDVTSDESVNAAGKAVIAAAGAPDVVINNAGQMFVGLAEAFSADEFTRQLDINVVGVHRVNRAFLPAMRDKGAGLIINVTSVAGRMAFPFFAVYHASKWGLEGYSQGMQRELASSGIDVVVVEPGPFSTELFPQSPTPSDPEERGKSYPEVVHQTWEGMGKNFEAMFQDPEVNTDPSLVVDRFVELVEMEPGTRPFRGTVGLDFGVQANNERDAEFDVGFMAAMGMTDFVKLKTE